MFGEIIIGPPGSGKSTYILYKKKVLPERSIFTINLDPGNNKTDFDYDIKNISDTDTYAKNNELGPHYSTKRILDTFFDNYDDFYNIIQSNTDSYFIFDFPGQIEFFMCNNNLRDFVQKLKKGGMMLCVVNLIDSVLFTTKHNAIMSHMFTTIIMIMVELPFVCVVSKGDNIRLHGIKIRELVEGYYERESSNLFHKNVMDVVENEGLLSFEILDYDFIESMMYLQLIIDKSSGYLYEKEPNYEVTDKESILRHYE